MPKFRKKPVVIEAEQWHGPRSDGPTPTPAGVYHDANVPGGFHVVTIHGQITPIAPGDWIIPELQQPIRGFVHAYPCKPDIFESTYDAV